MTRTQLRHQLLLLVDDNPVIPAKMQQDIKDLIDDFSDEALIRMIEDITNFYKRVTEAYKRVDRELKVVARGVEKTIEEKAKDAEKATIERLEASIKKAKQRL